MVEQHATLMPRIACVRRLRRSSTGGVLGCVCSACTMFHVRSAAKQTCRRAHLLDRAQLFDRRALHTLSAEDASNKLHSKNSDPAAVSMQTVQLGDLEGQADKKGQSALPFKPLCMTFQDVRYSVPFPKVRSKGRRPPHPLRPACLAGGCTWQRGTPFQLRSTPHLALACPAPSRPRAPLPASPLFRPRSYCQQDAPRDGNNSGEGEHANRLVLLKGITGSFRPGVRAGLRPTTCLVSQTLQSFHVQLCSSALSTLILQEGCPPPAGIC